MKKGLARCTAFCLAAGLSLASLSMAAYADVDTSMAGTVGYAGSSLNIRATGDTEGEIIGSVDASGSVEILGADENGWYKVRAGGVEGYVAGQFISTDSSAASYSSETSSSTSYEESYTDTTASYTSSSSDADSLYQAYLTAQEAAMNCTSQADAEAKADAAVAAYNAYVAAANGSSAAAASADTSYSTDSAGTTVSYDTASSSADVDSLYQAYLAAQEAAMTPVDEADAQAKADAAIAAYNAYVDAANAAGTTASETATATETAAAAETEAAQTTETEAAQTEAATSTLGQQIANYAVQFVGNPYVYGGASLTNGADCSGFTMAVFANFGIGLPHNAAAQSGCGTSVSTSDLQAGDLVFYGSGGIGHVAIYIGGGQVVHASNEQTGIKISTYNYRTPVAAVRCWS